MGIDIDAVRADTPGCEFTVRWFESAASSRSPEGHDPYDIQRTLRDHSINVSVTSQSSARLDFPERRLDRVVRASVHYYNTDADIGALIEAVANLPG